MRVIFNRRMAGIVSVLVLALAPTAHAGLGEDVGSIARDQPVLHARAAAVTPMQAYDLHETTTDNGTRIRQYVSRSGAVFAVTFNGRTIPDLRALLGSHYAEYAVAMNSRHTNHKVLAVNSPGLVMEIVKLPRGFAGSAHVPTLLPEGVSAGELR
jgi:hypothetical protein